MDCDRIDASGFGIPSVIFGATMHAMKSLQLWPHQQLGLQHAVAWIQNAQRGDKVCYAAPTGTGKSYVILLLQQFIEQEMKKTAFVICPSIEIIIGMLVKLGYTEAPLQSHQKVLRLAAMCHIMTPIAYRNALMFDGAMTPDYLLFDEGHHHTAHSWTDIDYLCGCAPSLAWTATPFRGTPKGTREFLERWGEPIYLTSYKEAREDGLIKIPKFRIKALVDDDEIEIQNGQFVVAQVEKETKSRTIDAIDILDGWFNGETYDKSTMVSMPSTELMEYFHTTAKALDIPTAIVNKDTSFADRQQAFRDCEAMKVAILHINTISEGVDLKLRRWFDLSPFVSPVKWLQMLGRITRNWDDIDHEYVCTNHNIERHGYLLEGCIPPSAIKEAQDAFDKPSKRLGMRVIGMEALGRFKGTPFRLKDGTIGIMYCMSTVLESGETLKYGAVVHPAKEEPTWARMVFRSYSEKPKWVACDPPTDVMGFSTVKPYPLTQPQRNWWEQEAEYRGLDPQQEVNARTFQVLPILNNLGVRFR